ncbi:MAG: penicillin-binding protein 2 [Verrucomicrobia bacterium]|nr:penicillin-binding protein 2 [Cytophagales bacterium]
MQEDKKWIIQAIFLLTGLIFLGRLFLIQIVDDRYKADADRNAIHRVIQYPHRGEIYDRKGKLLVHNSRVYDIEIIAREAKNIDTSALCQILGINKRFYDSTLIVIKKLQSSRKPYPLVKQLSLIDFAKIQDRLIDFPGLYPVSRTVRAYPHKSLANVLGYIGEISKSQLDKQTSKYYQQGDYVGISGIESFYEAQLRGSRGIKYTMYDVHGAAKGSYKNGIWDTTAVAGENLTSTIDLELQEYAEYLLENKPGTVVAIEPATGEVLAMVSYPSYDPNLLVGRRFSENFGNLEKDPLHPLFNRALMSAYPPGSFFKIVQALVGLEEGVITPETAFVVGTAPMKDHVPAGVHNDLHAAIQWSSNTYFYHTYRRLILKDAKGNPFQDARVGYTNWRERVLTFGIGKKLGVDLPSERAGILKNLKYFDKIYGENRWKFSNLYSMSIGQGELGVVPIQMANLAAIVANRGFYYAPHLIKSVGNTGKPLPQFLEKHKVYADARHFPVIVEGMQDVVAMGTVWGMARIDDIVMCGKTSTVQNPQGKDHAAFIAFAPKENPKIAIAVFLENAGWGGSEAAPIASLIIEKYIRGEIKGAGRQNLEKWMQTKNFMPEFPKPLPIPKDTVQQVIVQQKKTPIKQVSNETIR